MIYGVFGDQPAPAKLVTAALNDQLAAYSDEEFWLCVAVRKSSPADTYLTIAKWAERNERYVAYYTTMTERQLLLMLELEEVAEYNHYKDEAVPPYALVDRLYAETRDGGQATVYALVGDKNPSVDVRRAIARASDLGLEVRDLAEAGLTYIGVADNPIKTKGRIIMADENITLEEAGASADEGNDEAIALLVEIAQEHSLDPDDYITWADLAEALDPLMAAEESEEEAEETEEEEEAAPATRRRGRGVSKLTAEDLESKSVADLRTLAKSLGVDGWDKNRSAKLIQGILAAQDGEEEGETSPPARAAKTAPSEQTVNGITATDLARGLRAFADALEG